MKEMSGISSVRAFRPKRTLPSLPNNSKESKTSDGVFLSPKTTRKNSTNSPLSRAVSGKKASRLPIRRTQSMSDILIQKQSALNGRFKNQQADVNTAISQSTNNDKNVSYTPTKSNATKFLTNIPARGADGKERKNEFKLTRTQTSIDSVNYSSTSEYSETVNKIENVTDVGLDEEQSCITVAARVRPFNLREIQSSNTQLCLCAKENTMLTCGPGLQHSFTYDHCFWSHDTNCENFATQEFVYKKIGKPLLENAFHGYNTCLFAYGQTGSGKSYSMMGLNHKEQAGIVPRFCEDLFERLKSLPQVIFSVEISYFEIYNEKIHDLLDYPKGKDEKRTQLRVREHPDFGPYVQDLSTYIVSSYADVKSWLAVGNKSRATAATGMNEKSSRSHSVFTIVLTQTKTEVLDGTETQMSKTSKINLIDLAGSERASTALNDEIINSKQTYDLRLKEGGSINRSLHTLGKVISVLSSQEKSVKKKKVHIPYRDSILTWLLKDSLGGNSKTAMIATVSPSIIHYEETLSTLRYASQARNIVNRARVNEDPNAKLIRELLAEIERLKESSISSEQEVDNSLNDEIMMLREKLRETTALLAESTKNWQEKLELSEKRKVEEAEKLKQAGISFKVDNKLPNLVNLNEDPQLSEMLLYMLKEGETSVGRHQSDLGVSDHDIQLNGVLVAENHCTIRNEGESVYITAIDDAPTYVNGCQLFKETVLHHGDRLVIGGDHYFRFNHPIEVQKRKQENISGENMNIKDFEFARNELAEAQNARLQAELEEARIKAKEEIMVEIQVAKETAQHELNEQKECYEKRLNELQNSLNEVGAEKTEIEKSHQSAEDKINKLQAHKMLLEQEILKNRKKLQMEALAAKQALEETKMNQVRIISELEKEKRKIREDVEKLKNAKTAREERKMSIVSKDERGNSELLRISVMLREANKISESLKKNLTFSRDDILFNDKMEVKIRLNNTKLGITTVWSLQKFEAKLIQMRETYQQCESDSVSGDEDPFNDPSDQWEKDFRLESPSKNIRMSRRETLDLVSKLKSSLASPLSSKGSQSVLCGVSPRARLLVNNAVNRQQEKAKRLLAKYNKTESVSNEETQETSSDENFLFGQRNISSVPAICRVMMSNLISKIEDSVNDAPIHERIIISIQEICSSTSTLREAYKSDHSEKVPIRESEAVRSHAIKIVTSLDRLLEQSRSWKIQLDVGGSEKLGDMASRLLDSVRRVAAHLSKFLMGCDGDMVSLLEESEEKIKASLAVLVKQVSKLVVISPDRLVEDNLFEEFELQAFCAGSFVEGQNLALRDTIQDCNKAVKDSLTNMQKLILTSVNEVEKEIRDDATRLLKSLLNFTRNIQDIQKTLSLVNESSSVRSISGRRICSCHEVVNGVRSVTDDSQRLATTVCGLKIDKPKLLNAVIECSTKLKASVRDIIEHMQNIVEHDTTTCDYRERSPTPLRNESTNDEGINVAGKRSMDISQLFSLQEKLHVKAKNVRLTSRDLTQTLTKYSFLNDESTMESRRAYTPAGSSVCSRVGKGLSDRTNSLVSRKRLARNELLQPQTFLCSPREGENTVFRSKESPL